jgi:hypothetical protein
MAAASARNKRATVHAHSVRRKRQLPADDQMRMPIIWDACLALGVAITMVEACKLLALVVAVP